MSGEPTTRDIAFKMTAAQIGEILHHSAEWSRPKSAAQARRLWFGVVKFGRTYFVLSRRNDCCEYRLTALGLKIKAIFVERYGLQGVRI